MKKQLLIFAAIVAVFLACYFMPVEGEQFDNLPGQSLRLLHEYAQKHVLLSLVPAMFIAGAISVFISKASVMKYLGAGANRFIAYTVAAIGGTVLAVCSCTVLPLLAGIYRMGAGIGPATAFLYAGPAINVLAIILTARILGPRLAIARAVAAVTCSVIIGLLMHMLFRKEESAKAIAQAAMPVEHPRRPMWKNGLVLATMVAVLIFANWSISGQLVIGIRCCPEGSTIEDYIEGKVVSETGSEITLLLPSGERKTYDKTTISGRQSVESPLYVALHRARFFIAAAAVAALAAMLIGWFSRSELKYWCGESWMFARQILPLLFVGVAVAGLLFGLKGNSGLIPTKGVQYVVGGNSLSSSFFASLAGGAMYFATLTEVPIVEGLRNAGMGDGPALSLLLAGPALSLPNMLVIRGIFGTKKTASYITLVILLSTVCGWLFGALFN